MVTILGDRRQERVGPHPHYRSQGGPARPSPRLAHQIPFFSLELVRRGHGLQEQPLMTAPQPPAAGALSTSAGAAAMKVTKVVGWSRPAEARMEHGSH